MRYFRYIFIICLSGFFSEGYANVETLPARAVTYTLSGGRLGDNLIAYAHAKWISYRYGLPLLYKEFPLSDLFVLDDVEVKWTDEMWNKFDHHVEFKQYDLIDAFIQRSIFFNKVLYTIPYFPNSQWELTPTANYHPTFPYFPINWKDPEFLSLLKSMIAPKTAIPPMILPKDKITVALHVRKGSGHDEANPSLTFPLKFPPDEFFITQLRNLCHQLNEQPLYVHLFTDNQNPKAIQAKYKEALSDLDIEFMCRKEENRWDANVLEDFFALTQFDCAIHGESNFSVCASFLANYQIEILPKTYHIENGAVHIDEAIIFRNSF